MSCFRDKNNIPLLSQRTSGWTGVLRSLARQHRHTAGRPSLNAGHTAWIGRMSSRFCLWTEFYLNHLRKINLSYCRHSKADIPHVIINRIFLLTASSLLSSNSLQSMIFSLPCYIQAYFFLPNSSQKTNNRLSLLLLFPWCSDKSTLPYCTQLTGGRRVNIRNSVYWEGWHWIIFGAKLRQWSHGKKPTAWSKIEIRGGTTFMCIDPQLLERRDVQKMCLTFLLKGSSVSFLRSHDSVLSWD
jgi:hypothetical protein